MTPRSASEQLVARALELVGERPARVVDVGTGSGAIAIAIAAAAPQVEVWATDTSRCAVALARLNVRRHGLDGRVTVRHGDLLDAVPGSFDVIVANLPYVARVEAPFHPDLGAEPQDAVFADGDGLDPYRRLLTASAERLTPDGAVAIQLHRRVLAATRDELPRLRVALDDGVRSAQRHRFRRSRARRPKKPAAWGIQVGKGGRLVRRSVLMLAALAVVTTLAAGFASTAGAYGGGAGHDMWQIGLSFNCNNPDPTICEEGTGGFWGWVEFDRSADGTQTWGDAETAFCFHTVGGGGAGAGHGSIEIESWFIAPGSAGPQTFYASGEETDFFRGTKTTEDFTDLDTGFSAVPGHYSTDEIVGFKAPPGVAIQVQIAFRPAK